MITNSKEKNIFLTGSTGLLGSYLLKIFLENGQKVYAPARSGKSENAYQRVIDLLKFWDETIAHN
ncbi:MAG: SDR family oxidoreductase [Candidatus Omnitrophota bacterium]